MLAITPIVEVCHKISNPSATEKMKRIGNHLAAALMAQKRFDARLMHTHTFALDELPTAFQYVCERIEDAIKVVIKLR